jgi:hypothetical protein
MIVVTGDKRPPGDTFFTPSTPAATVVGVVYQTNSRQFNQSTTQQTEKNSHLMLLLLFLYIYIVVSYYLMSVLQEIVAIALCGKTRKV